MKRNRKIHDVNALEKEILLLKIEANEKQSRLTHNIETVKRRFPSFLMDSLANGICHRNTESSKTPNETNPGFLHPVVEKVTSFVSEKVTDKIEHLLKRFTGK